MGIRLHKMESVNNVWLTCCALHNILLNIDGLDKPWDGVHMLKSDYNQCFGELEFDDMPLAMQQQYSTDKICAYDTLMLESQSACMMECMK